MTPSHFRYFLVAALAVVFGAHAFFYFSVVRFFGIAPGWNRRMLAVVLALLSVSFILASFLAHRQETFFTRTFYIAGGTWLGLFTNLLMATVACRLVLLGFRFAGWSLSSAVIASVLLGMAVLYTGYGVWNAFNPVVRRVSVTVKGLPDGWKGKTVVQLSDVHLGHVYKREFLKGVVGMVNGLHPDMVVITGDLFDGMDGALSELAAPLRDLNAPDGVFFVTGNHETYLGVDKAFSILEGSKVTVMDDRVLDIRGLQLVGVGFPKRGMTRDVQKTILSLPGFVPGKPTLLLYHSPGGSDGAMAAGVNLQLSGHTHKGQIFPFGFITDYVYKGRDYGIYSSGDYTLYTTDGVGTWGPPMRTGNRPEIAAITLN